MNTDTLTRFNPDSQSFVCTCGAEMHPVGGMYSTDYRASMMPVLECVDCKHSHDLRLVWEAFNSTLISDPLFFVRYAAVSAIWAIQERIEAFRAAVAAEETAWGNLLEVADREIDAEEAGIAVTLPVAVTGEPAFFTLPIERMLVR